MPFKNQEQQNSNVQEKKQDGSTIKMEKPSPIKPLILKVYYTYEELYTLADLKSQQNRYLQKRSSCVVYTIAFAKRLVCQKSGIDDSLKVQRHWHTDTKMPLGVRCGYYSIRNLQSKYSLHFI